jgi:hypothetical protein
MGGPDPADIERDVSTLAYLGPVTSTYTVVILNE